MSTSGKCFETLRNTVSGVYGFSSLYYEERVGCENFQEQVMTRCGRRLGKERREGTDNFGDVGDS